MVILTLLGLLVSLGQASAPAPSGCVWTPPRTSRVVRVHNAAELYKALQTIGPKTTLLLEDGEYRLTAPADIAKPGTVLRGRSGNRDAVVIRGGGMTGDAIGVALSVSAPDVTIANLTVGYVKYHAIQVRGEREASHVVIQNVHLIDAGQQLLKVSVGTDGVYADDGLVACSRFEYSTAAPSDYTNGADLLATKGWVIRDNTFYRIRGPEREGWQAGPAILVWANSQDTLIERNLIIDSFRGIALGLGPGSTYARDGERQRDNQRGIVRNNVVCNLHDWADEAIEANAASDFRIEYNTVLTMATASPWSIGVRFGTARGSVRNNLTNQGVRRRNGGQALEAGNVASADASWFANAATCDLHLGANAGPAIDTGVAIPDVLLDYDRQLRDAKPDVGAFELRAANPVRVEKRR